MIGLAKNSNSTPDFYSQGDGSDPIISTIRLNGEGGYITESPQGQFYVWADDRNDVNNSIVVLYSNVNISITGSDTGIEWELSANGTGGWSNTISIGDIDVSSGFQVTEFFIRSIANNDGSVATANYTTADITINALEEPEIVAANNSSNNSSNGSSNNVNASSNGMVTSLLGSNTVIAEYDLRDSSNTETVTTSNGTFGTPNHAVQYIDVMKDLSGNGRDLTPPVNKTFFGNNTINGFDFASQPALNSYYYQSAREANNITGPLTIFIGAYHYGAGDTYPVSCYSSEGTRNLEIYQGGVTMYLRTSSYITNFLLTDDKNTLNSYSLWEYHIDGANSYVKVNGIECIHDGGLFDLPVPSIDIISLAGSSQRNTGLRDSFWNYTSFLYNANSSQIDDARELLMNELRINNVGWADSNLYVKDTYSNTSGLIGAWDFSDPNYFTYSVNNGITEIRDYSGANNNLVKTGDGYITHSRYHISWNDGFGYASFANDAALACPSLSEELSEYTILFVGADLPGEIGTIFSTNNDVNYLEFDSRDDNRANTGFLNEIVTFSRGNTDTWDSNYLTGSPKIWSIDSNGVLRANGRILKQFDAGNTSISNIIFGNNSDGTSPWQGSVSHILLYNRVLTRDNLDVIGDQLADDMGISLVYYLRDEPALNRLSTSSLIYVADTFNTKYDDTIPIENLANTSPTEVWLLSANASANTVGYNRFFTTWPSLISNLEVQTLSSVIEVQVDGDGGIIDSGISETGGGSVINTHLYIHPKPGTARPIFDFANTNTAKGQFIIGWDGAGLGQDRNPGMVYAEGIRFANTAVGHAAGEDPAPCFNLFKGDMYIANCEFDSCSHALHSPSPHMHGYVYAYDCNMVNCGQPSGKAHSIYLHVSKLHIANCDIMNTCQGHHIKVGRNPPDYVLIENCRLLDRDGGTLTSQENGITYNQRAQRAWDFNRGGQVIAKNIVIHVGEYDTGAGGQDAPLGAITAIGRQQSTEANSRTKHHNFFYGKNITLVTHGVKDGNTNPLGDWSGGLSTITIKFIDPLAYNAPGIDKDKIDIILLKDCFFGNFLGNPNYSGTAVLGYTYYASYTDINNSTNTSITFTDPVNGDFTTILTANGIGASADIANCSLYFPYTTNPGP